MTDSLSPGGSWTSSDPAVAYIIDSTGMVYNSAPGTVTITYTLGSSSVTTSYTVNAAPPAITASATTVCVGGTITLSDAAPGGTWTTSNAAVATIAGSGVVTGAGVGTADIYYTNTSGCSVYTAITVTSSGAYDSLEGPSTVCVGSTISLTAVGSAGSWSSGTPTVATISASGVVTGVAAGIDIITYTASGACGSSTAIKYISVITAGSAGTISGPATVAAGSVISLTDGIAGGTWSSSNTGIATVSSTGVVTGVATGTVTISYTVTSCGVAAVTTYTVTVTTASTISGYVMFPTTPYYGQVKVWLITLSGTTLAATDSTVVYCSGDSVFYQFLGAPTDSYRIKAAVLDSIVTTTGYIPTYHTSSYYWYSATVLAHVTGTVDANQNINMAYGATTSGPGFIGGNVTTGANKGTAAGVPVNGLMMYCVNSTTGALAQYTHTDASGSYSFSNLTVGQTYFIFPDSLNYATTAFTGISLTASAPSVTAASFIQHTISKTITPVATAVENVTAATTSVIAFPNPTMGKLNIQWNAPTAEAATVIVSDVTGREIYSAAINMHQGFGNTQVDLTALNNGLYIVSVKSASVNYSSKIQVQH